MNISKSNIDEYGKHDFLKAADAAKILKIGKSKLYQMMQRGDISIVRLCRSVRIRVEDLEKFIADSVGNNLHHFLTNFVHRTFVTIGIRRVAPSPADDPKLGI